MLGKLEGRRETGEKEGPELPAGKSSGHWLHPSPEGQATVLPPPDPGLKPIRGEKPPERDACGSGGQ